MQTLSSSQYGFVGGGKTCGAGSILLGLLADTDPLGNGADGFVSGFRMV